MENISNSKYVSEIITNDKEKLQLDMDTIIESSMNSFITKLKISVETSIDAKLKDFYRSPTQYHDTLYDIKPDKFYEEKIKSAIFYFTTQMNQRHSNDDYKKMCENYIIVLHKIKSSNYFIIRCVRLPPGHNGNNETLYYIFTPFCILQERNSGLHNNENQYHFYQNPFPHNVLFTLKYANTTFFQNSYGGDFHNFYAFYQKYPEHFIENPGADFEILSSQQQKKHDEKLEELNKEKKEVEKLKKKLEDNHDYYHELEQMFIIFEEQKTKFEEDKLRFSLIKQKIDMMKKEYYAELELLTKEKEEFHKLKVSTIDIDSYF